VPNRKIAFFLVLSIPFAFALYLGWRTPATVLRPPADSVRAGGPLTAAAAATPADPCAGRVQDKLPRAVAPLPLPAKLVPYTDPAFSTTVTRITDAPPSDGENAVIVPMYSTMQAWNADETRLVLYHRGKGHELYDGQTYQYLKLLNLVSPSDIEVLLWDPWQPRYLYYPSNYNAEPKIYIHDVETNVSYVWMDLAAMGHCPVSWAAKLNLGSDPSGVSFATYEPTVGMRCGDKTLIVNLYRKTVIPLTWGGGVTVAPMLAPGGQRFFYEATLAGLSYDVFWGAPRALNMAQSWEHGSVGMAGQALNAWYGADFNSSSPGMVVRTNLETAERKVVVGQANGWGFPPSTTHISGMTSNVGWLAASAVGDPQVWGTVPLAGEIIWANSDTGTVCRVAQHRSLAGEGGPWGYWSEPHVTISPSGTRAVFGSDWGGGAAVNTYVVDLR